MIPAAQVLTPGPYLYSDPIGGDPQLVTVVDVDGALYARFPPCEHDDEGCDVLVADMSGTFTPRRV